MVTLLLSSLKSSARVGQAINIAITIAKDDMRRLHEGMFLLLIGDRAGAGKGDIINHELSDNDAG
jgi:hypothetical protein